VTSVDLLNCLPVVDGVVFYPVAETSVITGKTEMYIPGGGYMARNSNWNQKRTRTVLRMKSPGLDRVPVNDPYLGREFPVTGSYCYNQGILLMDLSAFRPIRIFPHTECTNCSCTTTQFSTVDHGVPTVAERQDHPTTTWERGLVKHANKTAYTLSMTLPRDIKGGTPLVCLFGRLFLDPKHVSFTLAGDVPTVTVTVGRDTIERIILSNFQQYGRHVDDTTIVETLTDRVISHLFDTGPIGYGTEEDMDRLIFEDIQKPFVVMLGTSSNAVVRHVKPIMDIKPDKLLFPPKSSGLLVNTRTLEIIDYVRTFYDSGTLVTYTLQCPLNTVRDKDLHRTATPQIAMERYSCPGESKYMRFADQIVDMRDTSDFELVDIAFE